VIAMTKSMLTTIDNPYDPFTQYDDWYAFDTSAGYHSCGMLARIANTSYELTDEQMEQALDDAINEIVNENVSGVHTKVTKDVEV
jgi:hypothetical protein